MGKDCESFHMAKNCLKNTRYGENQPIKPVSCAGGKTWIRTTEVEDVRFTV